MPLVGHSRGTTRYDAHEAGLPVERLTAQSLKRTHKAALRIRRTPQRSKVSDVDLAVTPLNTAGTRHASLRATICGVQGSDAPVWPVLTEHTQISR